MVAMGMGYFPGWVWVMVMGVGGWIRDGGLRRDGLHAFSSKQIEIHYN